MNLGDSFDRLDEATREALLIGAQDILLGELLALVEEAGDGEVLRQAAVSSLPLSPSGLAHALHGREPSPEEIQDLRLAVQRLIRLSLLTPLSDQAVWVHRWTAESLRGSAQATTHRERCRRAGEYRIWRARNETHSLVDGMEAVENLLEAGDFDQAGTEAVAVAEALERFRQLAGVATFAGEVLRRLPEDRPSFAPLADLEGRALQALGYTELALGRYSRLLELHRARAEQGPDRADYQRDLSVSYDKIGDLQRALGQGDAARQAYERSLAISERLAAAEPERADYQRDLSVSCDKLARLAEQLGAPDEALTFRLRDLQIAERLLAREPERADLAQDLAISLLETARLNPNEATSLVSRVPGLLEPLAAQNRLDAQGLRLLQRAREAVAPREGPRRQA